MQFKNSVVESAAGAPPMPGPAMLPRAGQSVPATVHVVEDDPTMRRLVSVLLEKAGYLVKTYTLGGELLEEVDQICARGEIERGCVLLDLDLPDIDGLTLQKRLAGLGGGRGLALPVVVLTATSDVRTAVEAIKNGALDLLLKPFEPVTLLERVGEALSHYDQQVSAVATRNMAMFGFNKLTPREREVMGLVVRGLANKQVARELGLSERTVEVHRSRVYQKMDVDNVADLVRLASYVDAALIPQQGSSPSNAA